MPIKNIHKIEQPREKLIKYGPTRLNNNELLAILLHTGFKDAGVLKLAAQVTKKFPELKLANATVKELMAIKGVGEAKACEVVASIELGRRLLREKPSVLVVSPQKVWEECQDIRDKKKEYFVVFFLDTQNLEVLREIVSMGILNASLIHPREVFEPAVRNSVSHAILAHNPPSGSLEPSEEDLAVTRRLCDAGRIMGIEVLDHVIVTAKGYMSFKEKNLI